MSVEILSGLALFAFVSSITPGPNNLMLMTSGVNFGMRRSVPHILGVSLGFMLMTATVGLGLMQVFAKYPVIFSALKYICFAYLLYLAWRIATTNSIETKDISVAKPLNFLQAVLFQWVNPKAWSMSLTAISLYAVNAQPVTIAIVVLVFGGINLPCIVGWTLAGTKIRHFLNHPQRLVLFNRTMAVLLIAAVLPMLLQD